MRRFPPVVPTNAMTGLPVVNVLTARGWRLLFQWTLLGASVLMLGRLAWSGWLDIQQAASLLVTRQASLVVAMLVLEVAWTLSIAQVSRTSVLAVGGKVTRREALRISMAGFTLSRVVPVGGAAGGIFAARELVLLGNAPPVALAGMVVSWVVATSTLASLVAIGTTAAALLGQVPFLSLIPASLVLLLLVMLGALGLRALHRPGLRQRPVRLAQRLLRLVRINVPVTSWSEPLDAVACNLRQRRRLLPAVAWAASAWLLDMATLWLVFLAFGHQLGLADIAIGYGFANLLSALPELTPGWLGVFEAALSATYAGLGAPAGVAVVAVLAYRLMSFWLPVAAGIVPAVKSLATNRSTATTLPPIHECAQ
jgi:uncharacterized protein (TIRG00374 family)